MSPEAEGDEIELKAGMPVRDPDGKDLGTLDTVLVEEDSEEAAFVLLRVDEDAPLLVPWETLTGVKDDALVMDADEDDLSGLPRLTADDQPSEEAIAQAYQVFGIVEEPAS